MANFVNSLNAGLRAAATAARQQQEIKAVFEDLNTQLAAATDGAIAIRIGKFAIKPSSILGTLGTFINVKEHTGIGLVSTKRKELPMVELAEWEQDAQGYPCTISIGGRVYGCGDRDALEKALQVVLADINVGAKISEYISEKIAPPTHPTEESSDHTLTGKANENAKALRAPSSPVSTKSKTTGTKVQRPKAKTK